MLDLYCDRVASAVGRLSVKTFGMGEEPGDALAHHLGRALQLTNILRDLDEDADIGRLYLAREWNETAGIVVTQPPVYPVVCNVDASFVTDELRARHTLLAQVTGAVKWEPSIRLLIENGVETFVEIGPGKVLWGLMRQIDRGKTSLYVSDQASLGKTVNQLCPAAGEISSSEIPDRRVVS